MREDREEGVKVKGVRKMRSSGLEGVRKVK